MTELGDLQNNIEWGNGCLEGFFDVIACFWVPFCESPPTQPPSFFCTLFHQFLLPAWWLCLVCFWAEVSKNNTPSLVFILLASFIITQYYNYFFFLCSKIIVSFKKLMIHWFDFLKYPFSRVFYHFQIFVHLRAKLEY